MTSNLRSTSSDGEHPPANESTAPQTRERQRRTTPAANRPVASPVTSPVASGLSAPMHTSTRAPANFDPSSSREALIATAAYYRAEKRGFLPGHELQDWLAAEREVDRIGTDPA
jgi:hypothetical protein